MYPHSVIYLHWWDLGVRRVSEKILICGGILLLLISLPQPASGVTISKSGRHSFGSLGRLSPNCTIYAKLPANNATTYNLSLSFEIGQSVLDSEDVTRLYYYIELDFSLEIDNDQTTVTIEALWNERSLDLDDKATWANIFDTDATTYDKRVSILSSDATAFRTAGQNAIRLAVTITTKTIPVCSVTTFTINEGYSHIWLSAEKQESQKGIGLTWMIVFGAILSAIYLKRKPR